MSLISEKYKSYLNQINCLIYKKKKNSKINTLVINIITNLKTIAITQANTEVLYITYVT